MKRNRSQWEKEATERASPFAVYGTPLPPLDPEVRDDGSFVPVWKQEVRDERGRKRLHGAFTGGFSAGYFNTVGSKEGWTPATFKSSRDVRAKATQAKPEDFMDEEDLREREEARQLETARGFSGIGDDGEGAAPKRTITVMDLFTPPTEASMGAQLLKKMGWKEGQGVGPKVKRKARDDTAKADAFEEDKTYFFAPDDSQLIKFLRKSDSKGLGYDSGETSLFREKEPEEEKPVSFKKKQKKPPKRTGFGVGILNDDDEDEDPYEIKPKSSYSRVIGGDEKKKKKAAPLEKAPTRHLFIKKSSQSKSGVDTRKCNDGRLPLEGFVLASEPVEMNDSWYEPPEVPEDWFPAALKAALTEEKPHQSLKEMASSSKLDPDARGKILGEEKLPGKSIFDFLTPAARERLVAATGRTDLPPAKGEKMVNTPFDPKSIVPKIDTAVALGALNGGFMPYADDLEKRQRYRKYLEGQAGLREELPDRKPGTSQDDWIKELNEFAGAARIFKPMTGMMASRFTSSRSSASQIVASTDPSVKEEDVLLHRQEKVEDPAEQAAKMGMYGPMTRKVEPFFPSRLLCKRFGVRPPATATEHGEEEGSNRREDSNWKDKMGSMPAAQLYSAASVPTTSAPPVKGPKTLLSDQELTAIMREAKGDDSYVLPEREAPVKVDVERNEALEGTRAADEVFKAIFGDSDDEEE